MILGYRELLTQEFFAFNVGTELEVGSAPAEQRDPEDGAPRVVLPVWAASTAGASPARKTVWDQITPHFEGSCAGIEF